MQRVDFFLQSTCTLIWCTLAAHATVQLSCTDDGDTRYCINDDVQYQCSLPDGDVSLRWRIFDSNNVLLGQESYSTGDDINDPATIASDFAAVLTSNGNPLTSNISFTVSASHDGYMIRCEQGGGGGSETCDINIEGTCIIILYIFFLIRSGTFSHTFQ